MGLIETHKCDHRPPKLSLISSFKFHLYLTWAFSAAELEPVIILSESFLYPD